MKIIELSCPNCGADIEHDKEKSLLVCGYCGYRALVKEDEDNNIKLIEEKTRAKARGEYKARTEHTIRKFLLTFLFGGIFLAIIFGIGYFQFRYKEAKRPEINPFTYVDVDFTGLTGDGKAEIVYKENDLDQNLAYVHYELDKEDKLSEGDNVTLIASSNEFRLTKDTQKYKVEGLDLYLNDIDKISDKNIELIIQGAKENVISDIKSLAYSVQSYEIVPVKLYFLSDGKNENFLASVFKVEYVLEKGSKAYNYMVSTYDDVVVRGQGEDSTISYDSYLFTSNIMQLKSETEYGATLFGFETLEGAKSKIITSQNANMKFQEKDLIDQ